jgi:hypothetical protein
MALTKTQINKALPSNERRSIRHRVNRLAWLLDNSIQVPLINYRIGLDGLLGLIPGVGDLTGLILSSYIVIQAARLGVSRSTLLRMGMNVGVETLMGMIPIVGDLFDIVWKANQRNVQLIHESLDQPDRVRTESRSIVAVVTLGILASIAAIGVLAVWVLRRLWMLFT